MIEWRLTMRGFAAFFITLAVLAAPAGAEDRPVKDRLRTLLSDRHYHASEQAIKDLGPEEVNAALKEIAGDESEPIFRRVRAVHALGYFYDDETILFLENRARADGRLVAIRWSALRSLAFSVPSIASRSHAMRKAARHRRTATPAIRCENMGCPVPIPSAAQSIFCTP